jgi:Cytochrome P460
MPSIAARILIAVCPLICLSAQTPSYATDGNLTLPNNYREWVFLSSGLGMTYQQDHSGPAAFTNVFVNPVAYRSFLANGKWPDKTMMILEIRASSSQGSINKAGSYQGDVLAIESEVKDLAKSPGTGWAFYAFGKSATGKLLARTEDCYACHAEHAAVDNTFVQFYPSLMPVAKQKGTFTEGR